VEHGADVNKKNNKGETALFYVCCEENEDSVEVLIELGADINKGNNEGETALFKACTIEKEDIGLIILRVSISMDIE